MRKILKINNAMTIKNHCHRKYNNKKNKAETNFKGRIVNEKNLRLFGNSALYSSAISQIAAFTSGQTSLPWAIVNGVLGGLGFGAHFSTFFVKYGDRLKLSPNIIFQKAENIEQAANFAKKNFKIDYFNVDNLDTANWINQGITKLSNKFKGRTFMPKKIELVDFPDESVKPTQIVGAQYNIGNDVILFNKSLYKNIDNLIKQNLRVIPHDVLFAPISLKTEDILPQMLIKYMSNPNRLSFAQKTSLLSAIVRKTEVLIQIDENEKIANKIFELMKDEKTKVTDFWGNIAYNEYDYLFHEFGHMFDMKEHSMFSFMKAKKNNSKIFEKAKASIIMPKRAQDSFMEFNAEIFSGKMNGDKYIEPVENLFKQMNKIKMPE